MASLLEDLVTWMVDNGVAEGDGVDTFRDTSPKSPDTVTVLREYDSIINSDKGYRVTVRYVQVSCRDEKATRAKAKCDELYRLFDRPEETVTDLPDNRWAIIAVKNTPIKINVDEQHRTTYAFNVAVTTKSD